MGCRVSEGLSGVSKVLLSFPKVSKGDKAGLRSVSGVWRSRRSYRGSRRRFKVSQGRFNASQENPSGPRGVSRSLR